IEDLHLRCCRVKAATPGDFLPAFVLKMIPRQTTISAELRRQKAARRSRWCECLQLFITDNPLAVFLAINKLPQSHTHRHFVHTWSFYVARNGEVASAFPAVNPLLRVGFTAVKDDVRRPGEGLNITD